MQCAACGLQSPASRLPSGWHRAPETEEPICAECWRRRYVLRAVTFPVVGPVGRKWPEFREALHAAWSDATSLSNWLLTELYTRDVRREPGMKKLPKQPRTYLYPEARARFPALPSRTLAAIENATQRKYRAVRYKLIWLAEVSLPNYRYPTPLPVPNQAWKARYGRDNVPLIDLRLAGGRWTLQLRGGSHYRRQLLAFRHIVDGEAVQGELAIYRKRASASDHRNAVADRNSGRSKQQYRVMAKLVAWLPKKPPLKGSGTLYVRTDRDSLLIALNAKDERLWVLNADHIRRWEAEHRRRLNRWSDDTKAEQQPVAKFQSRREAAVTKYRRRLDSACHEAAAQLANYAARRRFAKIQYDDTDTSFCGRFPWFKLHSLIQEKVDARGIEFVHVSGPTTQESPGLLASPELEK